MTHPSSPPAPMTAERFNRINNHLAQHGMLPEEYAEELLKERDALTARVTELERDLATASKNVIEGADEPLKCCEEVERLEAELAAARKVEDGETTEVINSLRICEPLVTGNVLIVIRSATDRLTRLSAALKEAGQRASDHLRASEILNRHCVRLEARAQAAEAKLESARRDALEEAASECLILERDDAIDCPSGPAWKWYGKSRDHAAARIRAIQTSDRHD